MKKIEHIKKFLRENKYAGRRLRPLMDEKEINFVALVISKILEDSPDEISSYEFSKYDKDEHPFVDQAYFKPISDYLTVFGNYMSVYNIPCPSCKKAFIKDNIPVQDVSLENEKKCNSCGHEFDLFETQPGVLGIPTSYLDFLDEITKLVKT